MNNLKFLAIGLFVIFAGLFIFSKVRKDPTRDVTSIDSSSKAPRVHKKMSKTIKVVPPSKFKKKVNFIGIRVAWWQGL